MGAAVAIPLIMAGAGTLGKIGTTVSGTNSEVSLLKMQATQEAMASNQRMSQRVDNLDQVLGAQTADAAGRGLSLASTSLHAVAKDSFDKFSQDKEAEALGQQFRDATLQARISATRSKEAGGIFGAVASFGIGALSGARTGGSAGGGGL